MSNDNHGGVHDCLRKAQVVLQAMAEAGDGIDDEGRDTLTALACELIHAAGEQIARANDDVCDVCGHGEAAE